MGDVIHWPNRESGNKAAKAEADAHASQTEASLAKQIRRLRIALDRKPSWKLPPADQITVAYALHKLLKRLAKTHQVRTAEVLHAAGIDAAGDSTKHLSQYAIPEGGNPARLRKKVASYVKIAKAAASLAKLEESRVLWDVFGQTSWNLHPGTPEPAKEFEDLAERLCFIMERVARKHKLTDFFREVERAGVAPAPSLECEQVERAGKSLAREEIKIAFEHQWPQQWPIEFSLPSWEAETEAGDRLPAYPSVVLGSWRLGEPFQVRVTTAIPDTDGSIRPVSGMVQGRYAVELRLCIAPIGRAREATPALRVHLGATLSPLFDSATPPPAGVSSSVGVAAADEAAPILTFPGGGWVPLKRGRSSVGARNPATEQYVACDICVDRDAVPDLFKKHFGDIDSAISDTSYSSPGLRFLPITAWVCQDWFGSQLSEEDWYQRDHTLAERALGSALCERYQFPIPIYGGGTIADMIDDSLRNAENGLDLEFDDQAAKLRHAFEESRSRTVKKREEEWGRVQERWADCTPVSDD